MLLQGSGPGDGNGDRNEMSQKFEELCVGLKCPTQTLKKLGCCVQQIAMICNYFLTCIQLNTEQREDI